MLCNKKWLSFTLGCMMSLGVMMTATTDVEAADYTVGSYIVCNTDTKLFVEPDANSGVVSEITAGTVATIIENDEIYTKVTSNGSTGYLYQEFIGYDEAAIAAYEAELLARSEEVRLLAAIIQCESGGEPYEGQVAVGAVVMNRVESPVFPGSISEVIYQPGQFTPAGTGKLENVLAGGSIKESCHNAAVEAFTGNDNVGGLLYFRRNNGRDGLVIGNHVFY